MWGLLLMLLEQININPIGALAYLIGATEPAIRLLFTIIMSYPSAIIYHNYIRQQKSLRNLYFIILGVDMAFYNFGFSMYHNLVPVVVLYLTSKLLGAGPYNVIFTFVFNMAYLLIGYSITESSDYDITWTMPHCVLTLKLIALSFDLWNGQKAPEELSSTNKKSLLKEFPSIPELLGFIYFPSCFLVGPIFSMKRYLDFINDKYPLESNAHIYSDLAIKRLIQGIAYLSAHQIGVTYFSAKFMVSEEFYDLGIINRHLYCGLWAHFALYKYMSCWLLTEASCIRFGLSYNGVADGISKWDGCTNIKLMRFETATKFQHYIDSFNCNTNFFAAEYIYKPLKFLGNRNLSQFLTLLFLAVWHGLGSGYYMTFFNEFLIIFMEKELESIICKQPWYDWMWENKILKFVLYVLLKSYTIVFMGWSLVPFDLKVFDKWWSVYASLYFSGLLLFLPWALVYKPILLKVVRRKRKDE